MQEREEKEIKILYENKEYELSEQDLDRIIALASKMLRYEHNIGFINFEDEVEVLKQGHKSELYGEMKAELVYALEEGMFDNYKKERKEEEKKEKEAKKQKKIALQLQSPRIKQIPLTNQILKIRTISDNIFRPVHCLD